MADLDQMQAQLNRLEEKVDNLLEKIGGFVTWPWFIGTVITITSITVGLLL